MNIDFERFVKIAQSLSFTTFLILSVTAMSYAMLHLYTDTRTDWGQVQVNAQNIGQMSTNVEELISKIDSLLNELHTCLRTTGAVAPVVNSSAQKAPALFQLHTRPAAYQMADP